MSEGQASKAQVVNHGEHTAHTEPRIPDSSRQSTESTVRHSPYEQSGSIPVRTELYGPPGAVQSVAAERPPAGYNPYNQSHFQHQSLYGPSQHSIPGGHPPTQYYQHHYQAQAMSQQYQAQPAQYYPVSHIGVPNHFSYQPNPQYQLPGQYPQSIHGTHMNSSQQRPGNNQIAQETSPAVQHLSSTNADLKEKSVVASNTSASATHQTSNVSPSRSPRYDRPHNTAVSSQHEMTSRDGAFVPSTAAEPPAQTVQDIPRATNAAIFGQGPVTLPYETDELKWNTERTLNEQHKYCYCGDDRNLLDVDVQCTKCSNFFHGRCIGIDMGPVVPFMTNYEFVCKNCSSTLRETFTRTPCPWKNICASVMANLVLMKIRIKNQNWGKANYAAKYVAELHNDSGWYTRKADIIPFLGVPRHWAALCTGKDKNETNSWSSTLANALVSNPDIFRAHDESSRSANSPYVLGNPNLFAFRAGYLSTNKQSVPRKRKVEDVDQSNQSQTVAPVSAPSPTRCNSPSLIKLEPQVAIPEKPLVTKDKPTQKTGDAPAFTPRIPTVKKESSQPANASAKEVVRERKPTMKKAAVSKKGEVPVPAKLIRRPPPYKPQDFHAVPKTPGMSQVEGQFQDGPYFSVTDIPYNKRGFKYTLCEAAPALPGIMYRQVEVEPHTARLDWSDMSPYMYLTRDAKCATTDKGFRMGRANVGVREGQWYWEVKVLRGNGEGGGHVRLGIARREASLDGPIGFDGYSYGIRDKGGEKMHLSRPRKFMDSFGTGDVLGFHLTLPRAQTTDVVRDRIPIRYRQQLYFEQFEYTSSKEMEDLLQPGTVPSKSSLPARLAGSSLNVYKNGKLVGTAFDDLFSFWPPNCQTTRDQPAPDDGSLGYYPAISVYAGGSARLNFGPTFECPPEDQLLESGVVKSMSARYDEQVAEDVVYDLLDEVDIEGDLQELTLDGQQQVEVEPIREIAEYD
ncbi:Set1 complex component ash2 [Taphrina deformans PYCC 5710]|uniref:Set1 complex component ash2 n=1 Tax=Taphrina deformans (strain PYCC 5710 / ATCC 11124 / CBS 356.35 / IMI 108563 / JCM 9778 / NBRC 8474) TaxID=1097556 RepID=R4X8B0_TAPDE|nr:Set1 complex component ash2 [Taphrina deformans PYCC 5710]|eukprot:CCG81778.1 Set1 complex component ash2 [Taphrina deformans PYCC 5710]